MQLSANSSPPQIVPQIQTELVFKHFHDESGLSVLILFSLSYDPGLGCRAADSECFASCLQTKFYRYFFGVLQHALTKHIFGISSPIK